MKYLNNPNRVDPVKVKQHILLFLPTEYNVEKAATTLSKALLKTKLSEFKISYVPNNDIDAYTWDVEDVQ